MGLIWLWALFTCALVSAGGERRGGSLRGALEALQRRQRGSLPPVDYDTIYDLLPPQTYPDADYQFDIEDLEEPPPSEYILKLLNDDERPQSTYEYKIIKKKHNRMDPGTPPNNKESAFRERSHHSDNERLRDLFMDEDETEQKNAILQDRSENDADYAILLSQLWSKYKHNKHHGNNIESHPQGVVKRYKEKYVKKRFADNWGPIAFKRKRSSNTEVDRPILINNADDLNSNSEDLSVDPNYNSYEVSSGDSKDDVREEYAIAFQPLDDSTFSVLSNGDQYAYDTIEKRFPVTKRSSGSIEFNRNYKKKRSIKIQNKQTARPFRSSAGTDPKIIKDLSKIFGDSDDELIKKPVKRSSDGEVHHEHKPPQVTVLSHNETHNLENSSEIHNDNSHEQHGHLHHPGMTSKEADEEEKPISIKKKSIDWSDYFGIDKRKKKSDMLIDNINHDRLRKQYFDTFNKEVIYPSNSFRIHSKKKRNFVQVKPNEETDIQIDRTHAVAVKTDDKRKTSKENDSNLEDIDKKLRNMEGLIVDEALHYSDGKEELDSKEEQEMKEKLLSRLAAAYSLEKMRKALKEFKQSLRIQASGDNMRPVRIDDVKTKRVAIKKEKVILEQDNEIPQFHKGNDDSDDFEEEQGAGHYVNGRIEEPFSEGYMGGSGRHQISGIPTAMASGSCPVLAKIIQRCRGVDLLAGDRGQLFLPLCSLHQICYLCGEAPPTSCDLVFLSEADTACEGDTSCQRAARSALMALTELHDHLADELDGECEASPCLSATLKLNLNWQRALQ